MRKRERKRIEKELKKRERKRKAQIEKGNKIPNRKGK